MAIFGFFVLVVSALSGWAYLGKVAEHQSKILAEYKAQGFLVGLVVGILTAAGTALMVVFA